MVQSVSKTYQAHMSTNGSIIFKPFVCLIIRIMKSLQAISHKLCYGQELHNMSHCLLIVTSATSICG